MNKFTYNFNKDLSEISDWEIQWKMSFNPDPSKQAEVLLSRKHQNSNHDSIYFNHNLVQQVSSQKHLGMHLDTKSNFQEHLDKIMSKVDKTLGLLPRLQAVLLHPSLDTIYKAIIRLRLDYGVIIYDQAYRESFHQKPESLQYNASVATTGAKRSTSKEKLITSRTRVRIFSNTTLV